MIKVEAVAKIEKSLVVKTIGRLSKEVFSKVAALLNELFGPS